MKYVHVGGTNGKGSVSLKIATALQHAGYKTGLYISPHLHSYCERIKINAQSISSQAFTQYYNRVDDACKAETISLNFFEVITLIGFEHFRRNQCQYAVIEVGMGGTRDPTNVITPQLSVITNIGLDHTETLGNTLQLIAGQKAGIIKPRVPVVLGAHCQPIEVFLKKAKETGSPVYSLADKVFGSYEEQNNATVTKALQLLNLKPESIKAGLQAHQQCRMELLDISHIQKPIKKIYFDVGHNPPGLQKLVTSLRKLHPTQKFVVAFGTSSSKDYKSNIHQLSKLTPDIYAIKAKHLRLLDTQTILATAGAEKVKVIGGGDVKQTLEYIVSDSANQGKILVICGSFFIMSPSKGYFLPGRGYEEEAEHMYKDI